MFVKYRGFISNTLLLTLIVVLFSGPANAVNWSHKGKSECHRYDTHLNHHSKWSLSSFLSRHCYWTYRCNRNVTIDGGPVSQWREVTTSPDQTECINMYASAGLKGPSADYYYPARYLLQSSLEN